MAGERVWPGSIQKCEECGSEMKYAGLGEFRCTKCGNVMLNDYGRVRAYLEQHPGATQNEVAKMTGVPPLRIRQLLLDDRIEIAVNSQVFMYCEMCGASIRSGARCAQCEEKYKKQIVEERKSERTSSITGGFAVDQGKKSGEMRFLRK